MASRTGMIYLKATELEKLVSIVQYALSCGLQVEARMTDHNEWEIQTTEFTI